MNLLGNFVKATGVTAPPPAPPAHVAPTPLRQTAPLAPVAATAVQQSAHTTRAAALAVRPVVAPVVTADEGADASAAPLAVPDAPAEAPHLESLKEARTAWFEGKPRNAPAIWPIFPDREGPAAPVAAPAAEATAGRTVWGMSGILNVYGAGRSQADALASAVQAIREAPKAPAQGALGSA